MPTVEMPKTTIWPLVLSLGLMLSAMGFALNAWAFVIIGLMLFFVSLTGWMSELLPGRGHEHETIEAFTSQVEARPGTVEQLKPGMQGYRFRLPEKVHPISAGFKGGLVGMLVMPLPALAWGLLSGHGIWFPVNLLAGLVLPGVDALSVGELEEYRPNLLMLGVGLHAVMSVTIGLMYGVLLPTIPGKAIWQIFIGGTVIPLLWTGFSYSGMKVANPLLAAHVDWYWFALSQMVFGLAAAMVVVRTEKVATEQAGGPT
ncbi:hypothetical protein BH11PLA2_BH11PLA2_16690 [soil metagenome]